MIIYPKKQALNSTLKTIASVLKALFFIKLMSVRSAIIYAAVDRKSRYSIFLGNLLDLLYQFLGQALPAIAPINYQGQNSHIASICLEKIHLCKSDKAYNMSFQYRY